MAWGLGCRGMIALLVNLQYQMVKQTPKVAVAQHALSMTQLSSLIADAHQK